MKLISLARCLERSLWISLRHEVDVISRDLLAGSPFNARDLRAEIVNHVVLVVNIGDIPRLIEENYVAVRRREVTMVTWPKPVAPSDEDVGCRTDAEVRIAPVRDVEGISNANAGFWWQGSPARIVVTLAPGDPGWRPVAAWNPDPTRASEANPAAVVVACPSEIFVRGPEPATVSPDPVAIGIGSPIAAIGCHLRLKYVAVVIIIKPLAVRRETVVEHIIVIDFIRRVAICAIRVADKMASGVSNRPGLTGSVS